MDEVYIKEEPMDIEFYIDKSVDLPGPSCRPSHKKSQNLLCYNNESPDIAESSHLQSHAHSWQDDTGSDLSMSENCPAQESSFSSERQPARSRNSSRRKGKSKTRSRSKSHPRIRKISRKSSNKYMASIRVYVFTCGHACKVCNTPKAKEWLTESGFHFALPSAENDEDCHMKSSSNTNAMSFNQNAENSLQNTSSTELGPATSLLKTISENDQLKNLSHYKIPSYPGQKTAIVETTAVGNFSRHMIVPIGKTVVASPVQTTVTLPNHAVRQSETTFTKTADHHKQHSLSPGLIRFKPCMFNKNSSGPGAIYLKPLSSTPSTLTSNTGFIQFQPISSVASSLSSNFNIVQPTPSSLTSNTGFIQFPLISSVASSFSSNINIVQPTPSSLTSNTGLIQFPLISSVASSLSSNINIVQPTPSSLTSNTGFIQFQPISSVASSFSSNINMVQPTPSSLTSNTSFIQFQPISSVASSLSSNINIVQPTPSSLTSNTGFIQFQPISSVASSLSSNINIVQLKPPAIPSSIISQSSLAHFKPISSAVPKGSFRVNHIISSPPSSLPSSPKVVQILSGLSTPLSLPSSLGIIPMNSVSQTPSSLPSTQNNVQMKTGSSATPSLLSTQGIIQITSSSLPSTQIFTQITASSLPSTPKIVQIMSGSAIPSSFLSTSKVNQMKSVSSASSSLASTQGIIQSNSIPIPSIRVSSSAVPYNIQSLDRPKVISVIQLPENLSLCPIPPILAEPTSVKESVKLRQISHTVSSHSYQENVSSVGAIVSDSNQVDFSRKTSSPITSSSSQGKISTCPISLLKTPVSDSAANSIPYDVTLVSDGVDTSLKPLPLSSVITPGSLQKNSTAVLCEAKAQGGKPFPTQMFTNRKNIPAPHNAIPASSDQDSVQVRPVSPVNYTTPASSPKSVEVEAMPDLSLPLSLTEEGFRIELISDSLE